MTVQHQNGSKSHHPSSGGTIALLDSASLYEVVAVFEAGKAKGGSSSVALHRTSSTPPAYVDDFLAERRQYGRIVYGGLPVN
jgi:hypothetical protein